jgi:hypothetical protein
MKTCKNFLFVLSTGYIFVYFSEHLFWSRVRPNDSFKDWFGAWVAYSLMAFVFLGSLGFRVAWLYMGGGFWQNRTKVPKSRPIYGGYHANYQRAKFWTPTNV